VKDLIHWHLRSFTIVQDDSDLNNVAVFLKVMSAFYSKNNFNRSEATYGLSGNLY